MNPHAMNVLWDSKTHLNKKQTRNNMNKQETQTEFEARCFMHARPQEQQEDYMDIYAEPPRSK
jgi:hypothetical protein